MASNGGKNHVVRAFKKFNCMELLSDTLSQIVVCDGRKPFEENAPMAALPGLSAEELFSQPRVEREK